MSSEAELLATGRLVADYKAAKARVSLLTNEVSRTVAAYTEIISAIGAMTPSEVAEIGIPGVKYVPPEDRLIVAANGLPVREQMIKDCLELKAEASRYHGLEQRMRDLGLLA